MINSFQLLQLWGVFVCVEKTGTAGSAENTFQFNLNFAQKGEK